MLIRGWLIVSTLRSSAIELFGGWRLGGSAARRLGARSSAHHMPSLGSSAAVGAFFFAAQMLRLFESANESARRILASRPRCSHLLLPRCSHLLLLLLSILIASPPRSHRRPPDPIQPQPSPNCAAPLRIDRAATAAARSPADSSDASLRLFDVPEPCSNAAGVQGRPSPQPPLVAAAWDKGRSRGHRPRFQCLRRGASAACDSPVECAGLTVAGCGGCAAGSRVPVQTDADQQQALTYLTPPPQPNPPHNNPKPTASPLPLHHDHREPRCRGGLPDGGFRLRHRLL